MNLSDFGYLLLMMLWSALVVWLSYRLGYDNGRFERLRDHWSVERGDREQRSEAGGLESTERLKS